MIHRYAVSPRLRPPSRPRLRRLGARRRALALTALFAVAALGAAAPEAGAHASFLESKPAPGATISKAPQGFTLAFTEPLNGRLTKATLLAAGRDERVRATVRVVSGGRLSIRVGEPLEQGPYTVTWLSVSTIDGHVKEGSISFGVGVAAERGLRLEQSPVASGGWLRIAARAIFYAALLFFAGGVIGGALLGGRREERRWPVPPAARSALQQSGVSPDGLELRYARRTRAVGWIAAVAGVAVALAEASNAAGGLSATGIDDFLFSNTAGLARVVSVAAVVGALAAGRRLPVAAAALTALAFGAIALSGHASSGEPRWVAVTSDSVHLAAGAVWLGGIAQLALLWLPLVRRGASDLRRVVLRAVLPAFGRLALPAFLVVATTGLVNALVQLGHPAALWETGYGLVLTAKIAVVAAIALASYRHAFRLRPRLGAASPDPAGKLERRHWRLLGSEPVLGVGVVAAAALLVAFPLPPSQIADSKALSPCDPCPFARPAADELAVADRVGTLTVAGWLRQSRGGLEGTVRVIDQERHAARAAVSVSGAGRQRSCGRACVGFRVPQPGRRLEVRVIHRGKAYIARLPARWDSGANDRAGRLLAASQRAMRRLRTLRQTEIVQSVVGSPARVEFRFQTPDRVAYDAQAGAQGIMIGRREWFRATGSPWQYRPAPPTLANRPSGRFRWTVFAPSARLLGVQRARGRRIAEIAFFDYGYPVWYRMRIDLATRRALGARLLSPTNRIQDRYHGFDGPLRIEPPARAVGER